MASYNISIGMDSAIGIRMSMDDRSMYDRFGEFDRTAGSIMAEAIKDVLRAEVPATQRELNSVEPRHRFMGRKVADSLIVEVGEDQNSRAAVRFGSDPLDEGGVSGSRGGKIAQYLEYGMEPFEYPFTFKTITNAKSWGPGGGFINAKTGRNMVHPGIKGIGWLKSTLERAQPKFEEAIVSALNSAWGGM